MMPLAGPFAAVCASRVAPPRTSVENAVVYMCVSSRMFFCTGTHPSAVSLGSWRPTPAIVVTAQPCQLGLCTGRGRSDQGASRVSHVGDDKHTWVPTPAPVPPLGILSAHGGVMVKIAGESGCSFIYGTKPRTLSDVDEESGVGTGGEIMAEGGGGVRDGRRPHRRAAVAAAAVSALALCLVAALLASSVASARRPVLAQVGQGKEREKGRRVRRSEHSQSMGLFSLLGWGPCLELRACARPPPELLCLF